MLRATASPIGPRRFLAESTVDTTDATETTLQTIAVPVGRLLVTAKVKAARTGGAAGAAGDAAGYVIHAMLQNLAGTAEIIGSQAAALTAEDESAYACAIDVTGATARIRVTGVADTNITWEASVETY